MNKESLVETVNGIGSLIWMSFIGLSVFLFVTGMMTERIERKCIESPGGELLCWYEGYTPFENLLFVLILFLGVITLIWLAATEEEEENQDEL